MQTLHVALTIRGQERYIVLFDRQHFDAALQVLGRWASNKDLTFDWHDASKMAKRMKEITHER